MWRFRFFSVVLCLMAALNLSGQQDIPKIGLVDSSKIITTFYQDSKAMRDLKNLRESILEEVRAIEDEIVDLRSQKLDAERRGDRTGSLRLESQISEKEQFLSEYKRVKEDEIRRLQDYTVEDNLLNEIVEAIEYIAVSEGYSLVLEKQNPFILHYGLDIDITDKVLKYLLDQASRP